MATYEEEMLAENRRIEGEARRDRDKGGGTVWIGGAVGGGGSPPPPAMESYTLVPEEPIYIDDTGSVILETAIPSAGTWVVSATVGIVQVYQGGIGFAWLDFGSGGSVPLGMTSMPVPTGNDLYTFSMTPITIISDGTENSRVRLHARARAGSSWEVGNYSQPFPLSGNYACTWLTTTKVSE